ncbi:hypothetical protein KKB44_03040 [Candidatus Micrarchaeota archaeon]|nr:hypothetical protein [Candidatus Micrarchaeota archaeon]
MAGAKLCYSEQRETIRREGILDRVKRSRWMKYFLSASIGVGTVTNINYFGGNEAMAEQGRIEAEDVTYLQQRGTEAADAYRNYVITGNESQRDLFWRIYNEDFRGAPLNENATFMAHFSEEMERVREDPQVSALLEAYREDRRPLEPVVMVDFIDTLYNIRAGLARSIPNNDAVDELRERVETSTAVRADTDVGRVRALMEEGYTIDNAVRKELQRAAVEELSARYGENLTQLVITSMPAEQARIAIDHLRNFILTGDQTSRDEFVRIWNANTSDEFTDAFTEQFRERIYNDTASGLASITQNYNRIMSGIEPGEFATLVREVYNLAITGTRQDVDAHVQRFMRDVLRRDVSDTEITQMNEQVIGPLLDIVARGQAGHAIRLMNEVIATGSQQASNEFRGILNGRFLGRPIEENETFWNEFQALYRAELNNDETLAAIIRGFGRNILPIAIRDIYTELARETPDLDRLRTDYGPELVNVIIQNSRIDWLMRDGTQAERELSRRVGFEDTLALQLLEIDVENRGAALIEVYSALREERIRGNARLVQEGTIGHNVVQEMQTVEENFDQLSWVADMSPADAQGELERRTRTRRGEEADPLATALISRYGNNAGTVLTQAYSEVQTMRERRAELVSRYGEEFVNFVETNIENLHWLVLPIEQIEEGMRTRSEDAVVTQIQQNIGYTYGTFAIALHDIYENSTDRSRLVSRYGEELVGFVETNRAELEWLSGDVQSIETALQERTDETTRELRAGRIYSYGPVQLVAALARARQSINRGGVALVDARDALGTLFVRPVVSREVVTAPTVVIEGEGSRAIESRSHTIANDIGDIRRQLQYSVLEPARALLLERIRRWEIQNREIVRRSRLTSDAESLERLEQEQRTLSDSMLNPQELRRSVEMAYSLIHVAQTGGDLTRVTGAIGTVSVDVDSQELRELLDWFGSLTPEKQAVVEEIVASVLHGADPELYEFVGSMNERGFFNALTRTYAGLEESNRRDLVRNYGEEFVLLVEAHAPHLQFLESPGTTREDLRQGENVLFASILIRCHRALVNPQGEENRARMVELFGEEFVVAVEAQREHLAPLLESEVGLDQVRELPEDVRGELMAAYSSAYSRTIDVLTRTYLNQGEELFYALGAIYAVWLNEPAEGTREYERFQERIQMLNVAYGEDLVTLVHENMNALRFLERPSARVSELENIPEETLERLYSAFEEGPGATRANFMENYDHVARTLPGVYARLRNALLFSNPSDEFGTNFEQAVNIYRQEFGENNYLFNQYFNLELFRENLTRIGQQYHIDIPDYLQDEVTPEELARFFQTDAGRQLIRAGRTFYEGMETEYLLQRNETGFSPETGEFTDENVQQLRNELTILDAVYMGIALEGISGSGSAFQRAAATELMNTLLVISHRDPYLVGPYLLYVLPALLEVAQDERTLIAGMTAFRQMFTQRYAEGQRYLMYSNAINREYFLGVFRRIGEQLPEITSTFDHHRLEDEMRMVPEPMTDEGFISPFLYRQRPGWWQYDEEQLPTLYGQSGQPLSLLPRVTMPNGPMLGLNVLDSGAMGLFSNMYDQVRPPTDRMFRMGVPARYRIGALGSSTIIRRITQLFGAMPVNYQDYWLSGNAEGGMYYSVEGEEGSVTERGAALGEGQLRGITGGERWELQYTGERTEAEESVTGGHRVDYTGEAVGVPSPLTGPVPLPLLQLVPVDTFRRGEGVGIHRAREEFTYESSTGMVEGEEVTTAVRTDGLLESYQRIARESGTDMLFFVAGTYVPELLGPPTWRLTSDDITDMGVENPEDVNYSHINTLLDTSRNGETEEDREAAQEELDALLEGYGITMEDIENQTRDRLQEEQGEIRSRLFFITGEGDVYQLAFGRNTEAELMNYLYGGVNTQNILASLRFVGSEMLTEDSAAAGFDGAAVGFTIPTGDDGDTVSALLFGELVRNLSTMDPVHIEEATGMAVTNLLQSGRQRDVYAAFYRGAQTVELDPENPARVTDTHWAHGSGELMWRRMRVDPLSHSWEARLIGGYPATIGGRWRHEVPTSEHETYGYGVTVAYNEVDLLREYRVVEQEADEMYQNMTTMFVDLYGWNEDQARNAGWLIAANYMYGRLEGWVGENEPEESTGEHYGRLLFMYWANRHRMLVGGERIPGFANFYSRIEDAMTQIQQNPQSEAQVLENLTETLRTELQSDIWRFALGYGYDGENVRLYTIGSLALDEERSYGNLYGLFLFGRPTAFYADILGHFYGYTDLIITENEDGTPQVSRESSISPWLDLYTGIGIVDWPSLDLMRYERDVTITPGTDVVGALQDVYSEMGSGTYNGQRLIRNYGQPLVDLVRERGEELTWMIRPQNEVAGELRTRGGDPVVDSVMAYTFGDRIDELSDADYNRAGEMLVDIYGELRRSVPNLERLQREYGREVVEIVRQHSSDLSWLLRPEDDMRAEFTRRATGDSLEERIAGIELASPAITSDELSGEEVQLLFEQNLTGVLLGITNAQNVQGLAADGYDVILGTYLREDEERHGTFYVMMSPVSERPGSRGSIVIGNEADYEEWRQNDRYIGRGVARLEVTRGEEGDYTFTFSGDRRLRAFTAERVIGGITLPLTEEDYENYRPERNWTVGGIVHLLQDHQNDWLAGALYGIRDYENEEWRQLTISTALRHQLSNTATYTDQIWWYVFFNRATGTVVLGSEDVFENDDELRDVCGQLGCDMEEIRRTTAGTGITWARADIITGERLSLHFFFEGGVEEIRDYNEEGAEWEEDFIMRSGLQFTYERQPEGRAYGTRYSVGAVGARGEWPIIQGEVTRPEYLRSWSEEIVGAPPSWWFGLYGRIEW